MNFMVNVYPSIQDAVPNKNFDTIVLVDFAWILYRSYHAYQGKCSINLNGLNVYTGDIHGTLVSLASCNNAFKNDRCVIVVCLDDRRAVTNRREIIEDYKVGRKETPEVFDKFEEILDAVCMAPNVVLAASPEAEADDIIYSICEQYRTSHKIRIFVKDRDLYQTLDRDPNNLSVRLFNKVSSDGVELQGPELLEKEFASVDPKKLAFFRSLSGGDTGDALKAYSGFPKVVAKFLAEHFESPIKMLEGLNTPSVVSNLPSQWQRWYNTILKDPDRVVNLYDVMKLRSIEYSILRTQSPSWEVFNKYSLRQASNMFNSIRNKFSKAGYVL